MRLLLSFAILFIYFQSSGQNCRPNIAAKVYICRDIPNDSVTAYCLRKAYGLKALDSNFQITGYILSGSGEGFEDYIEERMNTGAAWNEAWKIIIKTKAGSILEFSCIKAKYKDSPVVYILQPLYLEIK